MKLIGAGFGRTGTSSLKEALERAKANVPSELLLVYSVQEGWEPLCNLLGKPVPEIPFPHSNSGVTEVKRKMRLLLRDQLLHRVSATKLIK